MGNYCHGYYICGYGTGLVVGGGAVVVGGGSFLGDWVFTLVIDFIEVMRTSPPELAHRGGGGRHSWPTQGVRPKLRNFRSTFLQPNIYIFFIFVRTKNNKVCQKSRAFEPLGVVLGLKIKKKYIIFSYNNFFCVHFC